jgi:hypothetical protein
MKGLRGDTEWWEHGNLRKERQERRGRMGREGAMPDEERMEGPLRARAKGEGGHGASLAHHQSAVPEARCGCRGYRGVIDKHQQQKEQSTLVQLRGKPRADMIPVQ